MYHVELRQFPHNSTRFNLTEGELRATVLDAWAQGGWIDFGERKWSPHQATLTVLEGPEIPVAQLSMGRGWRNAKRQGKDVTEELLAAARKRSPAGQAVGMESESGAANSAGVQVAVPQASRPEEPNQLARDLLALLGDDPVPLLRAWQLALERHPDRTPSECLGLAEDLLRG